MSVVKITSGHHTISGQLLHVYGQSSWCTATMSRQRRARASGWRALCEWSTHEETCGKQAHRRKVGNRVRQDTKYVCMAPVRGSWPWPRGFAIMYGLLSVPE